MKDRSVAFRPDLLVRPSRVWPAAMLKVDTAAKVYVGAQMAIWIPATPHLINDRTHTRHRRAMPLPPVRLGQPTKSADRLGLAELVAIGHPYAFRRIPTSHVSSPGHLSSPIQRKTIRRARSNRFPRESIFRNAIDHRPPIPNSRESALLPPVRKVRPGASPSRVRARNKPGEATLDAVSPAF